MSEVAETGGLFVRDVAALARAMTPEELAERVAHHVLVAAPISSVGPTTWTFETRVSGLSALVPGANFYDYHVYPISGKRRLFRTVASVGRGASSDVRLHDESVSKLHARIEFGSAEKVWISDAGSSGGTLLNGRALSPGEKALLNHRDDVTFGRRTLKFYRTTRLHTVLVQMVHEVGEAFEEEDDDW